MSDNRTCGCTGESSVCDQGDGTAKLLVAADGLGGVEHLRHTASLRSLVTDEDCVTFLNFMFQDSIQTLFLAIKRSRLENCLEHLLRACGVLDDRTLRSKVSAQDRDAAVGSDGLVSRTDDVLSCDGDSVALVELLKPFLAALIESVLF